MIVPDSHSFDNFDDAFHIDLVVVEGLVVLEVVVLVDVASDEFVEDIREDSFG
jgi:hypothetical protein